MSLYCIGIYYFDDFMVDFSTTLTCIKLNIFPQLAEPRLQLYRTTKYRQYGTSQHVGGGGTRRV